MIPSVFFVPSVVKISAPSVVPVSAVTVGFS